MARPRGNWTLDTHSIEYLKLFPNQSKIIDEAIELHRNKDKKTLEPITSELQNMRIKL